MAACVPAFAGAPAPERLLPDNTLAVFTVPDFTKARELYSKWPQSQFWSDEAMKPFKDKLATKFKEEFLQPLERELDIKFADFAKLAQGQITIAVDQNGWQGDSDPAPALLLFVDSKDNKEQLKTTLASLRKKWVDANKPVRTEKIRDIEFIAISVSSNDLPKTVRKFFPAPLETHEVGEEEPKKSNTKSELFIGQADSLLLIGSSMRPLERVVAKLEGGSSPALGDQAAFTANFQAFFREAPAYGWINTKTLLEIIAKGMSEKKENPAAPNPFELIKPEKLIAATGLGGLKTVALSLQEVDQGLLTQIFLGVPESSRQGILKILAGEPKEVSPPPYVPADAVKFQRWRIDGQKAWATLEKMLADISPQTLNGLNFLLETANTAAKDKDPGFDIKKNLIGNLGDDIITYDKAVKGTSLAELNSAPSLFLLGSPNPTQLAASLKSIFIFQGGQPTEREFLGRKVFSIPVPTVPLPMGGAPRPSTAKNLHYAAGSSYVAFSTDPAVLEEYLRSSDSQAKALRETPGLSEASQKVTGPGSNFFGYENQAESIRPVMEALRKDPSVATNMPGLSLLTGIPGMATPEAGIKEWFDFSLLPPFEKVAKYFYFSVMGSSATTDGITYRAFAPVPPALKSAAQSK